MGVRGSSTSPGSHFRRTNQNTQTKEDEAWSLGVRSSHCCTREASHKTNTAAAAESSEVPSSILPPCVKQLWHFFHVVHRELSPHPLNKMESCHWSSLQGWGWFSLVLPWWISIGKQHFWLHPATAITAHGDTNVPRGHLYWYDMTQEGWRRGTLTVWHNKSSPPGPS